MRYWIIVLLFLISSCDQFSGQQKFTTDPKAIQLNDSAVAVVRNTNDYATAVQLLDQAIRIDTNYLLAYSNKLNFHLQLKEFNEALTAVGHLQRLKPDAPDYRVMQGMIHDLKGDSSAALNSYYEADRKYNAILDTMNHANSFYDGFRLNKAINLVLSGKEKEGNLIMRELQANAADLKLKPLVDSMAGKSKRELLYNLTRQ